MATPSPHDLIPLDIAVRGVRAQAYPHRESVAPLEQLNGIAYAVAAMVPLYTYATDGSSVRQLSAEELAKGMFRGGGKELHFLDGRAAITAVAVKCDLIEAVAFVLRDAQSPTPDS